MLSSDGQTNLALLPPPLLGKHFQQNYFTKCGEYIIYLFIILAVIQYTISMSNGTWLDPKSAEDIESK